LTFFTFTSPFLSQLPNIFAFSRFSQRFSRIFKTMEKISIGVCVLRKDLPLALEQILSRVQMFDEFTVSYLKDEAILEKEIYGWPIFDCLIAFGSGEFPRQKVKTYAALREPFLVNELEKQHLLHDRSLVYELLAVSPDCQDQGMKIKYAFFNRKGTRQELDYYIEEKNSILVHGNRFRKLFVEKPDHGM
ncbi:hypothetical protein Leryth_026111, partial [Lithospermum erythrorhizon]